MVMIGLVIFDDMARGRSRSKSAISRITGISRGTLDRRLVELERAGHIERVGQRFVATPHKLNTATQLKITRSLINAFIQLGQELSNLGVVHDLVAAERDAVSSQPTDRMC